MGLPFGSGEFETSLFRYFLTRFIVAPLAGCRTPLIDVWNRYVTVGVPAHW